MYPQTESITQAFNAAAMVKEVLQNTDSTFSCKADDDFDWQRCIKEKLMNAEFTAVIKALIAEQGKDALVNPARCKAFLPDYTKSEFTKERRLLLKVVETGAAKEIDAAANLDICKKQQVRYLKEELFMAEDVAVDVVDMLAFVLRGNLAQAKPAVLQPAPQKPQEPLYNIRDEINTIINENKEAHHDIWWEREKYARMGE
jgi:hypothetical protein